MPKRKGNFNGPPPRRRRAGSTRDFYDHFMDMARHAASFFEEDNPMAWVGHVVNYMDPTVEPLLRNPSYDTFRAWFHENPERAVNMIRQIPYAARQAVNNIIDGPADHPETANQPEPVPSTPPKRPNAYEQNKRPRKMPRNAPDEGPPPEYDGEPAETGTEEPLPSVRNMSTAYSDSYCTLDLGSVKVPHKGGRRGDHVPKDVIGQWQTRVTETWTIDSSNANSKKMTWLGSYNYAATVVDANGIASIPTFNYATNPLMALGKFNSALQQYLDIKDVYQFATSQDTAFYPDYTSVTETSARDQNYAKNLIAYKNQVLYLRLKNVSHDDASGTQGNPLLDETAIHVKLIMVRAKNDLHYGASTSTGYQSTALQQGWQAVYDRTKTALGSNNQQPLWVTLRDNEWFSQNWDVIHVKKFTLCPGQEAILTYHMLPTQILSYQHLLRNNPATRPVIIKKGETQLMYTIAGCVGTYKSTSTGATYNVQLKPTRLAIWGYQKYEAAPVNVGFTEANLFPLTSTYPTADQTGIDPDTEFA